MRNTVPIAALVVWFALGQAWIPQSSAQRFGFFHPQRSSIVKKAKRYNLVPVTDAAPGVFVDLRYTVMSIAGKPLYPKDMPCLIHKESG
ncbi:MAG: hypothetical protein AAGJ31_05440, partial [Verrucomicrobiota bacterium]